MVARRIDASVGMYNGGTANCYNVPKDVAAVTELLNAISDAEGGSQIDASASPRDLFQAISNFQRTQNNLGRLPRLSVDGHVDPGAATLARLNSVANKTPPNPTPQPAVVLVVPFTEAVPLLISKQPHNTSKGDLKTTPTPTSALPFARRLRVEIARGDGTASLEDNMLLELAVPDGFSGTTIGRDTLDFFKSNRAFLGTDTHAAGSDLSELVRKSDEFKEAHDSVKDAITLVVSAGALAGNIDYHDLAEPRKKVPPPGLGFGGVQPLHVYIGSFQGVNVFLNDFSADTGKATYSADLTYEFFDHFGADDGDLEFDGRGHGSPGQVALWILQRERRPGHMPFIVRVVIAQSIVDESF